MIIPTYHVAASEHTSRSEMAARYPAPYSITVIRHGWIGRYVSDHPCIAMAEAWRAHIQSQPKPPQSWCLVDVLTDEDAGSVFFMWVNEGVVQEAVQCAMDALNSVLLQRHSVFITDAARNVPLPTGITGHVIAPFEPALLAGWALKKTRKSPLIGGGLAVTALVIGAGLLYGLTPEPTTPESVSIDPYAPYRHTVSTAMTATPALNNMVALAAYSALLPQGWTLDTLALQGNQVVLRASRTATGTHTAMVAWLGAHPDLADFSRVTFDSLTMSVPLNSTLAKWEYSAVPIEPMTTHTLDTLKALGWTLTLAEETGAITQQNTMTLTKTASLADIQILATTLAPLPASITALSLVPAINGVFTTTLTLALIGTLQ